MFPYNQSVLFVFCVKGLGDCGRAVFADVVKLELWWDKKILIQQNVYSLIIQTYCQQTYCSTFSLLAWWSQRMRCLPLLECLILMGHIHRLWFMLENCFGGIVNSEISDCNRRAIHHWCCHSLLCLFNPPQYDKELLQGRIKCILRWKILLARVTKSVNSTCAMHCSNVGKSLIPYCAGKWCISGRVEGRWLKGFWWKPILFNLFLQS